MALANLKGRAAFIFTEIDFDIDQIVGVKNIKIQDIEELANAAMQQYDPDFRNQVKPGDLLIGNNNFGYGHPHYPPMKAMRHMGVSGVIAESFAPGYWRGEIAMGFPQVPCPGILDSVNRWDELEVDWTECEVRNLTQGVTLSFDPLAQGDIEMLESGGLVPFLHSKIGGKPDGVQP